LVLAVDLVENDRSERDLNVGISFRRTGELFTAASPNRVEID